MNPFFIKYPFLLKKLYPNRITRLEGEKTIYLTFDDGPIPEITPWVLQTLKEYNAKATFFCIGDNIRKYPTVFQQIIEENHSIGNHTFNHLNGWKTKTDAYVENVLKAEETLLENRDEKRDNRGKRQETGNKNKKTKTRNREIGEQNSQLATRNFQTQTLNLKLFRPPFGKIKNSQAKKLVKQNYKIVMWDVISGDFDSRISKNKCLRNVLKNVSAGSTVVFHDSIKASESLKFVLPKVLDYYTQKGFSFKAL
ncbi:Peptidoglycan/xylan/chitin deacetylase, PgdA/CDA1 family [Salegentibacter holothuriorum]|uniref:Peptidoglycan/xylan/chitin deacetylase, PgdA/CDA1 family n=1 Tax=Salegentibacter holothuriorum TaxID=241145 RepID=A0A1T5C5T8_9FLAO|nr:polysaccharide deacetylase family protein [Salegentibacter holothuriorum]SKB54878.1 Peptidoglycan/xylan/chitin deacetylase, PgdA/CDA1 family [Salegentibacter holothuriorum]